jgi:hypothetical protein
MHRKQARGRRGAQNFLPRGDGAGHAGAMAVRLFRCAAHRAEPLRHHADKVGMGDIDFRIDHRDRDIGAPGHAVNVQHRSNSGCSRETVSSILVKSTRPKKRDARSLWFCVLPRPSMP